MRIDLAYFGRDTAYRPILVRTGREIAHRAAWGRAILSAKLVASSILAALCAYIVLVLVFGAAQ